MRKTKWILDPTHSELGFKVKHLMITNVSGSFKDFRVEAETADDNFDDLTSATITLTASIASVSTNNEQRDAHLRASDFFEAEKYPELKFVSAKIEKENDEVFTLYGDLTLRGVTHPVRLNAELTGITRDPWGGERAGFSVNGKINRSEWGINFNGALETGGVMLGEEVKINSEIQLVKQAEMVSA